MTVRRPTAADHAFLHDGKPMRISQRQVLIGEPFHDAARFSQFRSIETSDLQFRQSINESEELAMR